MSVTTVEHVSAILGNWQRCSWHEQNPGGVILPPFRCILAFRMEEVGSSRRQSTPSTPSIHQAQYKHAFISAIFIRDFSAVSPLYLLQSAPSPPAIWFDVHLFAGKSSISWLATLLLPASERTSVL